ncbi:MAG TPA: UDP-3-O-(3-hydroxymyristoyl)glucosamine N-acyltransferase [Bacteroidia bacterium]|nr:UDP-3-O-(3-hydroxymyristoyl)glucosamine N-acyltransferase [Bacteroidia bacterium]
MKLNEIISVLKDAEIILHAGDDINEPVELNTGNKREDVIFWCSEKYADKIVLLQAGTVICSRETAGKKLNKKINYLMVSHPRLAFLKVMELFADKKNELGGNNRIAATVVIHPSVKIGSGCSIGHHVIIEEGCSIGSNVKIGHNTVVHRGTIIGNLVVIGCNNTIGGVGFGYEKEENGKYILMPHLGNVVISDFVEVGNNTCIDRAVLGSTIISEYVKIDNLVHIAHGVFIGKNSLVIANSMIGGSVRVGENCWLAPSASVINKGEIGDGAVVGMGAVVIKRVEVNQTVAGNPAQPTEVLKKINSFLRKQSGI